ncbi:dATP/dGTP pyrophosphohydrolase domain-containing protein [Rhizobium sp. WW22]|uniref:dATP/dGTP pyrophosphohydrolase domain-containing protein n=1 Tax=Rhizobium sp. WW22 TaxID=3389070 RepID=UPI00399B422B
MTSSQDENLLEYFKRQIAWSRETFGPALRTKGVLDHIRKELTEIECDPRDLSEWVDVIILAMDGFWRHGGKASDLLPALLEKQRKNMARSWPDWRTMSEDQAIEHDRSMDGRPDEDH